ncbi:MAG: hypothetical protein U0R26_10295 [Solirubrobacterales bacterium]
MIRKQMDGTNAALLCSCIGEQVTLATPEPGIPSATFSRGRLLVAPPL